MLEQISYDNLVKKVELLENALIDLGLKVRKEDRLNLEALKSLNSRVSELEKQNA